MRGQRYECIEYDGTTKPVRRFVAIWVPDAKILFHWDVPFGRKRIEEVEAFPFDSGNFSATRGEPCVVTYAEIKAAKNFLKQRSRINESLEPLRLAQRRFAERHERNEYRLEVALRGLAR
ncbi:MAG: hypothetical protein IT405_03510 [Candidatus Yanofskybacteria bacterium]|nr:hypothetical protein [Candidatus Yanofskybacteria bacterium]